MELANVRQRLLWGGRLILAGSWSGRHPAGSCCLLRGACSFCRRRGGCLYPLFPLWTPRKPSVVASRAVGALGGYLHAPLVLLCAFFGRVSSCTDSAGVPPLADPLMVSVFLASEAAQWFRCPGPDLEGAEQPHSNAVRHLSPAGYFYLGRRGLVLPQTSLRCCDVRHIQQKIHL